MKKALGLKVAIALAILVAAFMFFSGSFTREMRTIRGLESGRLLPYVFYQRFSTWGDEALPVLESVARSTGDSRTADHVGSAFFIIRTPKSLEVFLRALRTRMDAAPGEDDHVTHGFLVDLPFLARRVRDQIAAAPPEVRQHIVDTLGAGLRHQQPDLREASASALGKLGVAAATKTLQEALATEKHWGVRYNTLFALGTLGDDDVVEFLIPIARSDESNADAAIWSLGRIGTPRAVDVLLAGLEGASEDDREYWVEGLAEVKDRRAEAPLLAIARSGELILSSDAFDGLGRCGGPEAESFLLEQAALELEDGRVTNQGSAVSALGEMRSEKAVPVIAKWIDGGEKTLRARAIEALGQIRGAAALEILVDVLAAGKEPTRDIGWAMRHFELEELCGGLQKAMEAGKVRAQVAFAALVRAMDQREPSEVVVSLVRKVLQRSDHFSQRFPDGLLEFIDSYEDIARTAVQKLRNADDVTASAIRELVDASAFSEEGKREILSALP